MAFNVAHACCYEICIKNDEASAWKVHFMKRLSCKFLFLLLFIIPFIVWGGLNTTGFCWAEKRWLSEDEKINNVIQHIYAQPPTVFDSSKGVLVINPNKGYKTVEDFKKHNPNCCSVGAKDFGDGIWAPQSILSEFFGLGRNADIVSATYVDTVSDSFDNLHKKQKNIWVGSSNCGILW